MMAAVPAACDACGSPDTTRVLSRVAVLRSGTETTPTPPEEDDPKAIARWVRRMSQEMGEPLEPEMDAELERIEAGEMPDDFGEDGEEEFGDAD
jgi:hypothetical protein